MTPTLDRAKESRHVPGVIVKETEDVGILVQVVHL